MKRYLTKNLLLTFLFSLFLTGLMFAVWYGVKQRGFEEGQALKILFFVATIFQNLLLAIASLPVLFLSSPGIYFKKAKRMAIYFGGPVLTTIFFIVFIGNSAFDKVGFLLPGISFITIHAYFYNVLNRKMVKEHIPV